ncbi:hypothetical protein [Thermococcus sp.]|uniref:hypothetical protein n=1 Tax=Thermococcus sp. TaxID=35749 RepID=UPI0025CEC718|nr:hypothetical protein [Thermococcus sp.]
MRRLLISLLLLLLLSPLAGASSFSGWLPVPDRVTLGGLQVNFKDVSMTDGSALIIIAQNGTELREVLPVGGGLNWSSYGLNLSEVIMDGNTVYALVDFRLPYLLQGQSIRFGNYTVKLVSVSEGAAVFSVSNGSSEKTVKSSGGNVSFGSLELSATLMPVMFDGYLLRGHPIRVGEWAVNFTGYNVTRENGNLVEVVELEVGDKEYYVEAGKTLEAGGLIIDVRDLIGAEYLRVKVRLKGAYVTASVAPSFDGWLPVEKTGKVGPYIVRVEAVLNDTAYVSISNPCGMPLKTGFVSVGNVSRGLYYGGILIGIPEVRERAGIKEAHVIAFLNGFQVPKVKDVAFLNVSLQAPPNATQYSPINGKIILRNTGETDLRYIEVALNVSKAFRVKLRGLPYIPVLKQGESVEIPVTIVPLKGGNLTLGNVLVTAHAPYELSCYGLEGIEFTSGGKIVHVAPLNISYHLTLLSENGRVGEPLGVNITVTNTGGSGGAFNLSVAVPEGFGIVAKNFTLYGKWLQTRGWIGPRSSRVYHVTLVPTRAGEYKLTAALGGYGILVQNSTVITVAAAQPSSQQGASGYNATSNSTCQPKVVTEVVKVPVPANATVERTGLSLKDKLLYFGGAFLGGVLFLLALAWIAARMEEK